MKSVYAEMLDDVVGSYDQTKTTIQGRIVQKTVNSVEVLGPPLNKFVDIFTDSAVTPANLVYLTANGRLFTVAAEAGGLAVITLHTVNLSTLATTYIGKIQIQLPDTAATTHTYRSIRVNDDGTTGWDIMIVSVGSVVINGGVFLANNIALSDFVPVGFPTISFATGNDQKAVYFLQDPTKLGASHTAANVANVATAGAMYDTTNDRLYTLDGVAATPKVFVYDITVAPTYSTVAITGTAATDIINDIGHSFINGDQVVFSSLSGGAGLVNGTTYFVVNSVAAVSYQVSATSGGAAINFTTDITSGNIGRAFGITGSNFVHQTGTLPALSGTLLLTDSVKFANPVAVHPSIDGAGCMFFATTTTLYLGKLSELTVGAVTWPSLQSCNVFGSANQITAPTAAQAEWSDVLQRVVYSTNTSIFVIKQFVNNSIETLMGGLNNRYLEALVSNDVVEMQMITVNGMRVRDGILVVNGSTVGQRGVYLCDLRSNYNFDYSYVVTKVLNTPQAQMRLINTLDQLFAYTGSLKVYYRTSGFGSISGGWVEIPFAEDLSAFAGGDQVQFKIMWDTLGLDTSIHAQLSEFVFTYESVNENSDNWQVSKDLSSTGATHKVVFYLANAYASSVPTLYTRAYQQGTTTNVGSNNTSANPGQYRYSTNGGASWTALGTIPNTVGTLVEWTISPSPTVDYLPSIRES